MKYHQLVKAIDSTSRQLLGRAAAAVNQSLVIRNWLIGAYLVEFEQRGEDRAQYGARLLPRLAADLKKRKVSGASPDMLERMRQVYFAYPQIGAEISAPVVRKSAVGSPENAMAMIPPSMTAEFCGAMPKQISAPVVRKSSFHITPLSAHAVLQFSWTHLIELVRIDDALKRAFYENECLKSNWSKRQLQRQIGSLLFERTGLSQNKTAVIKRARAQEPRETIEDLIRDPYILEFTGLAELPQYTESNLETALLDHLQKFLLELGAGFLFEARQRRITVGNEHDYIDLVFYHRHLRCHVLLDLKTRPFRHGDAGQMNFYLNWWKQNATRADEQPPVGILLCSDRDHTKVEFATAGMANKLFVSRYLTLLPSAEQLQHFVERDRAQVEAAMEQNVHTGTKPAAAKGKRKKARPSMRLH